MHILGISSLEHDPSAALLGEKGIVAAIEEGKLLRTRESLGIPRQAIQFCLAKANISWKELSAVSIASDPLKAWRRHLVFRAGEAVRSPVSSSYYQTKALGDLARALNHLRVLDLFDGKHKRPILRFEHALCHAASAFYASPFEQALILTLDEQGDGRCGLAAIGDGVKIREQHSIRFPHSLPWVYSQVTELLGFRRRSDEHKTQWLGLGAEPAFRDLFLEMLRPQNKAGAWPHMNRRFFRRGFVGRLAFSDEFYKRLGISDRNGVIKDQQLRASIAASIQQACSVIVVDLVESLRKQFGAQSLCLAGGMFLNPLIVAAVEKNSGFQQIFVQPAAGNEGTALGAAWLAYHHIEENPRSAPLQQMGLGPSYSNHDIKQVLDNCKVSYRYINSEDRKIEAAVQLLQAGKIVGWFQGATEFGPRALGNRSLLASPWAAYVKENLNDYVKHRESFRAFALCVRLEDSSQYFDCSPSARFMTTMSSVRPEARKLLEGFVLPGDLVRLQVVERAANPLLWRLLQNFGQIATAPILVNTSFNLFGEPLVVTPRDAVRSYFCSGMDALIAGDFVLSKS